MRRAAILLTLLSSACRTNPLVLPPTPPPPILNACGGQATLSGAPGDSCGCDGQLACDGAEALHCDGDSDGPRNACGTCGPTPPEVCNGRDDNCDGQVDEGCLHRLDTTGDVSSLALDGDRIVFSTGSGVLLADGVQPIASLLSTPTKGTGTVSANQVAIDGDRIVWGERLRITDTDVGGGSSTAVVTLTLGGAASTRIFDDSTTSVGQPTVDAGRIAFAVSDPQVGAGHLELWSAATGRLVNLTAAGHAESGPSLSGDWIGFVRSPVPVHNYDSVPTSVFARNLVDGREIELSSGPSTVSGPIQLSDGAAWFQNKVVDANGRSDGPALLYRYDLTTGTRTQVSANVSSFAFSARHGSLCYAEPGRLTVAAIAGGAVVPRWQFTTTDFIWRCGANAERVAFVEYNGFGGQFYFAYWLTLPPFN